MEDLLYEVESVRRFVGLRVTGALPNETTILNFRHLLEKHGLGEALFGEINAHLASLGHRLKTGTIVDASLIEAPPSTKNRERSRDPEIHQAKKGSQWHFGMKAHIGVDSESGLAHSMATTAANVSDVTQARGCCTVATNRCGATRVVGVSASDWRPAVPGWIGRWRCGLGHAGIWSRTVCWRRRSGARRRSEPR